MSELINDRDNAATIRWKLLASASALALTAYVASVSAARAEDSENPELWIELGGQAEIMKGASRTFTAPFMFKDPMPELFAPNPLTENQRPSPFSFGAEGKITFQPEGSDWLFSAAIRYGRAHSNRHFHHQGYGAPPIVVPYYGTVAKYEEPFADTKALSSERHTIVDFSAGKDVGLGAFGSQGTSTLSAGVRFAQFRSDSTLNISAKTPVVFDYKYISYFQLSVPANATWYHYGLTAHAARSFKGIGPSLSWNASATLFGDTQEGALTFDWGINAALLFGKQKAKTDHHTSAKHYKYGYHNLYAPRTVDNPLRERSVSVPNIGGFAALSFRYVDAKISLGYRADAFLNAMDTGIDAARKSNLTFNGPYASISIGLGD